MRVWLGRFNSNYAARPGACSYGLVALCGVHLNTRHNGVITAFDAARLPKYALHDANCANAD
jgi:hypothetical protein